LTPKAEMAGGPTSPLEAALDFAGGAVVSATAGRR
jgi:hypothetical protein